MSFLFRSLVMILLISSTLFAQSANSRASARRASVGRDSFPSIDEMIGSLSGGEGKEFSLADSIKDMISSMGSDTLTENTEATVRSAIEGKLVVEEVIPEANKSVVEAIDVKTKRYSPRLKLDFREFPLQRVSRRHPTEEDIDFSARITGRLRQRLGEETLDIEFGGRSARLYGTVTTERQRELAEMMLHLEPGIDEVKNELSIGTALPDIRLSDNPASQP